MEGVVELKDISLVYGSTAAVVVVVNGEIVGGTFSVLATLTFPATGGPTTRATKTLPLDGLICKQVQIRAASAAPFALYSGELRVRPFGVYLDGAASEMWQTQPMSLGV